MSSDLTVVEEPKVGGFEALNLIPQLQRAVRDQKYTHPTPIQAAAIPHLLEGKDILGCAQTGTGKTAAFTLPLLQRLAEIRTPLKPKEVRALIVTPTRELAGQISDSIRVYGRHLRIKHTVVYGGVSYQNQIRTLGRGVDVLVATPGRLLDLFESKYFRMDKINVMVLDEADTMLDMGFLPDMKRIFKEIPSNRQSMLFSATLPEEIVKLTKTFLNDPIRVSVNPPASTVEKIDQRVLFVERESKTALLQSLLENQGLYKVLVFNRTKHGANRIAAKLNKLKISTEVLHGNKSQSARSMALRNFRSGKARVMVATDVASRGLDIDGITHVINFELPKEPEVYVHRIGRTARAGAVGMAISFCDEGERGYLRRIERVINRLVTVVKDHPFHSDKVANGSRIRKNGSSDSDRPGRSYAKKSNGRSRFSNNRSSKPSGGKPGFAAKANAAKPKSNQRRRVRVSS
jgi:ATP-dependent RNA helicase RhlE